VAAGPALAHSLLLESSPAAGATLASAPDTLMLRFNNRIEKPLSRIRLVDAAGVQRPLTLSADGGGADRLIATVPSLPAGTWRVEWQVLSTDGHVVAGRFEFKVEAGAEFVVTRPIFDVRAFERVLPRLLDAKLPIVAGVFPFESARNAEFMANEVPGVHVPDALLERMRRADSAEAASAEGVAIAREVAAGRLDPDKIDERTIARHLDEPGIPDVDLFVRSSGEQRTSNFLPWHSTYAELFFTTSLWPDVDRRDLWDAVAEYARRRRRYGAATG